MSIGGTDTIIAPAAGATRTMADSRATAPKLSVCLITYNRAKYLDLLLEDFFQTPPFDFPFEIVLCDNHSTDETPEVMAKWQARHPEVKPVRQKFNVGPEHNLATSYRMATGEYCIYLADDDRLIPEIVSQVVAYMDAHPTVAVVHSPWELWDDIAKRSFQPFYHVAQEQIFSKGSAVDMFNMVLQNRIFPETCVYRTSAVHRMHTVPFNVYSPYLLLAHVLDYGDVAFLPQPFYRQLMLGVVPKPEEHLGVQWTVTRRDSYAAGFEYLAQKSFRHFGVGSVPAAQVEMLQKMVLGYNVNQLSHGVRLLFGMKNYRGAYEFMVRQQANGTCNEVQAAERRAFLIERASIQCLIETFEVITAIEEIALFRVRDTEQKLELFREQRPSLQVKTLSPEDVGRVADPERMMVLVGSEQDRDLLLDAGFLPGLVFNENDLNRLFLL